MCSSKLIHASVVAAILVALLPVNSPAKTTSPDDVTECCVGVRGNVNGQGIIDLVDLSSLVSYLQGLGYVPPCPEAADLSGNGQVSLLDLSILVAYLLGDPVTLNPCPPDTNVITITARLAALDSVTAHLDNLNGQTHDSIAQALSAYIRSLPAFEAAGISGKTTVWGRFRDGRVLIIPNNKDPDFPADSGTVDTVSDTTSGVSYFDHPELFQPMPRVRSVPSEAQAGIPVELPASSEAYLLSSMSHKCYTNPLPTIKALLERQNYYCHVFEGVYPSNGTIENLVQVHDCGVFYFDGHGGEGKLRDSTPIYGLWTADVVTDFTDQADSTMLTNNELCYMVENAERIHNGVRECGPIEHYGITPAFVSKYMHFSKNALVYIDACSSAEPNMQTAFANANASVYLGWTSTVSVAFAIKTSYYLFDRLLGTNAIANRENPSQRPFDIQALFADMTARGLTLDAANGSDITSTPLRDHFGLLAPTIMFVSLYEDRTQPHMILAGEFGSDRGNHGTVTINGQPTSVVFWSPDTLLCTIDGTGGQAVGTVQVYEIATEGNYTPGQKQLSNPVNISEWNGTIEYTLSGPDSLLADYKMGIHFRDDVHAFREKPHQKPFVTLTIFHSGLKDSTGKASFSGSHVIHNGDCTQTISMSGGFDLGNVWQPASQGSFKFDGGVDMIHNQLQFNFYYGGGDVVGHTYFSGPPPCPTADYGLYLSTGNDSCLFNVLPNNVMQLRMAMDSTDLSIKPDSTSCSRKPIYWLYGYDQIPATAKIQWNKFPVKYAPDPKAGR